MTLIDVRDASAWEAFMLRHSWAQFPQSWIWGEFRRARGLDVRRYALVDEKGEWLAAVALEYRPKKLVGGYWFVPRGPVFASTLDADGLRATFRELLEKLLREKLKRSLFWRFEPAIEVGAPEGFIPSGLRRNDAMNPSSTVLLELGPSEEHLLNSMHSKTRYNIRLGQKHGIKTRFSNEPKDIQTFMDLMDETAARDGFVQRDRTHLQMTYDVLALEGMARIRLAEHNGNVLAANLEVLYGDTVTYLYGSSSTASRELKAPYVIQWDAICQAKRDGFDFYDFWGANPISQAAFSYKDSWEGITRFKRGWGGRNVDLYGTWDLPFNMLLYRLAFPHHVLRD